METGSATRLKVLDAWWFGPVGLIACETNPRGGLPDCCVPAETTGGMWISPPMWNVKHWEPEPHQESLFVLYVVNRVVNRKIVVLFETVCDSRERLERKTEQFRSVLERFANAPLSQEDFPKTGDKEEASVVVRAILQEFDLSQLSTLLERFGYRIEYWWSSQDLLADDNPDAILYQVLKDGDPITGYEFNTYEDALAHAQRHAVRNWSESYWVVLHEFRKSLVSG